MLEASRADVIVRGIYSFSYGMSAAIDIRQGQVVIAGCEEGARTIELYADSPVINITPDQSDIEEKIYFFRQGLLSRIRQHG